MTSDVMEDVLRLESTVSTSAARHTGSANTLRNFAVARHQKARQHLVYDEDARRRRSALRGERIVKIARHEDGEQGHEPRHHEARGIYLQKIRRELAALFQLDLLCRGQIFVLFPHIIPLRECLRRFV